MSDLGAKRIKERAAHEFGGRWGSLSDPQRAQVGEVAFLVAEILERADENLPRDLLRLAGLVAEWEEGALALRRAFWRAVVFHAGRVESALPTFVTLARREADEDHAFAALEAERRLPGEEAEREEDDARRWKAEVARRESRAAAPRRGETPAQRTRRIIAVLEGRLVEQEQEFERRFAEQERRLTLMHAATLRPTEPTPPPALPGPAEPVEPVEPTEGS